MGGSVEEDLAICKLRNINFPNLIGKENQEIAAYIKTAVVVENSLDFFFLKKINLY